MTGRGSQASVVGTVAFTDLVGFTEFTALQGDEAALALLGSQDRILADVLPEDARVVKELGDGLLIWFPAPGPAVTAALAMVQRFDDEPATGGLGVRIGLHHGAALPRGDDLIGHDVNLASRIAGLAGPGEVLVSEAAKAGIAEPLDGVEFDELGPVVMKGIPDPVRLWRASCPTTSI